MGAPIPHVLFDSQLGLTKGNNSGVDQQIQVWFSKVQVIIKAY